MKKRKDPAAVKLGRKRWEGVSAEERTRLMKQAVAKRQKPADPEQRKEIASIASRAYWDALSPQQRSDEMRRRAAKRKRKTDA